MYYVLVAASQNIRLGITRL